MAITSGGSRGGARGGRPPPPILGEKEGKKASWTRKSRPPPTQGLDPPLITLTNYIIGQEKQEMLCQDVSL